MERASLTEYDPRWPVLYAHERRLLAGIFDGPVEIEHVGSTSVPGMVAKPVIDILVGLTGLHVAEAAIAPLSEAGYEYVPEHEAEIPDRRYFRKRNPKPRTHHLHCVVLGGPRWAEMIRFRDLLRTDAALAARYAQLKRRLAGAGSKRDYTARKGPFIRAALNGGSA